MEQAQKKVQKSKEQDKIRRRRKPIDTFSTAFANNPLETHDDEMEQESIDPVEMTQHSLAHPDETLHFEANYIGDFKDDPTDAFKDDFDNDFELETLEEDSIELNCEFDSYDDEPCNDQDDLIMLNDLCLPENVKNNPDLHLYTTTKTHDFCRQLVEIFRDANISNSHCSRLLKVINEVLPQPHNSPTTLKSLYNSMNSKQTHFL